jgi:hypothetical protein
MTRADIQPFFPAWAPVFLYDESYARPTNDWIFNKFYPWFKTKRWNNDVSRWTRKNDCDNFARAFCVFAQDAHADSVGSTDEGLAVGEFCYIGSSHVKGPHAIVCAFTEDGLIFIEPQTGQRLALTPSEIQTCFRVSF